MATIRKERIIFLYSGKEKIFKEQDWHTPNTYDGNYKAVPSCCGVYLLAIFQLFSPGIPKGQIVYVGSSKNLAKRYNNHEVIRKLEEKDHYVRFYFKPCENFIEEEKSLIKSIRPKFNIIHNGEEIH